MNDKKALLNLINRQTKIEEENPITPKELLMKPLADFIDKHGMIALRKKYARYSNYIINGHQFWHEIVNDGLSELNLVVMLDLGSLTKPVDKMINDTKNILKLINVKNYRDVDTYKIYIKYLADIKKQVKIAHRKRKPSYSKIKRAIKASYDDIDLIAQQGFELDSVFYLKDGYQFNGLDMKQAKKLISNAYDVKLVPKRIMNTVTA